MCVCTLQGKSMSLICGALKWLKDSDERDKKEAEEVLTGQQRWDEFICARTLVNCVYSLTSFKQEKNDNLRGT